MGSVPSSHYYAESTSSIISYLTGKRQEVPFAQLFVDNQPYTFIFFTFPRGNPIWIQIQNATGQWNVVYENVCMNIKTISKNDALLGSFARYIHVAKEEEQEKFMKQFC
jgi:hypothetical protein